MALASERQEHSLTAVRERGTVRLADLGEQIGVTAVTVRRDVTLLAERGLVQRVHGGVTLPYRGPHPGHRAAPSAGRPARGCPVRRGRGGRQTRAASLRL
ncbi:DeoR family transcriptional regulator [Streptomyces rimosus]|uniref:DeoR family transcriptional regulator n=1 Tax=Streptomyces rimosus TaxID=1927 RepID=UPI001F241974|nr:DeoR family transcriptional regulator [Streptomyces rimosus]